MDDVNYLRRYATEEAFLFVVDSSKRDTSVFPLPHEYQVHFNSPFRNVVELNLVDATIPRTEYLVEAGKNTLVYTYANETRTATVTPGDYNILQLVGQLNALLPAGVNVQTTSAPAEISNKVAFVSDAPFRIHAADSGLRTALGLGFDALDSGAVVPGVLGSRTVVSGQLPATTSVDATAPVRQAFVAPATGTPHTVSVYVSSASPQVVRAAVLSHAGAVVGLGTVTTTGVDFEQLRIPLDGAPMQAGGSYHVLLQGGVRVFTGGESVSTATGAQGGAWHQYASWTSGTGAMCLDVEMAVDGYRVEPPGVVNLTGEPYVLVRCPEVENELFRDRAFERVHGGLGLVKLGNYGFREQRYDFTSFPGRRLPTPIGKLGKLTIQLRKGDGEFYDTKGVDHHLVLVIKYLEITRGPTAGADTSVLNPHYEPNMLRFLQAQPLQRM